MRRSLSLLLVVGLAGCATSPLPPLQPEGEYRPVNATHPGAPATLPVPAAPSMTATERLLADIQAMSALQDRIRRDSVTATAERASAAPTEHNAIDELQARVLREAAAMVPVPPPPAVSVAAADAPRAPGAQDGASRRPPPPDDGLVAASPPTDRPTADAAPEAPTLAITSVAAPGPALDTETVRTETVYRYPEIMGAAGRPGRVAPPPSGIVLVPAIRPGAPSHPPPRPKAVPPARSQSRHAVAHRRPPASPATSSTAPAPGPPTDAPSSPLPDESTTALSRPIVSRRSDEQRHLESVK